MLLDGHWWCWMLHRVCCGFVFVCVGLVVCVNCIEVQFLEKREHAVCPPEKETTKNNYLITHEQ